MPESASPPDIGHSKEHKFSSKSKWRGKLFAAEGIFGKGVGDHENDEEDVAHFLQPGTPKPGGTSTGTVKAPRIDTAKAPRWSSTSEGLETAPSEDKYHAAKPKQNKGLQVKFVSSVPEIIGEGGDESEIPVVHVSKERLSATAASSSRRIPFQRASTGPSEAVRDRLPANAYLSPENEVPNDASRPFEEDVRSQIPPRDAGDFFPNHNDMDEEFPRNSPVSRSHNEDETNVIEDTSDLTRSSSLLKPSTPFNIDASSNSLTPHAAPDPIPKLLTPSSPERGYFDVRHDGQSSTRKVPQLSPSLIQQEDAAAAAYAKQKPMSLRDVAKQVGSDALDDFDVRVRRFNEIFRLGVAVHQDTMEVPITRWIRTALWWFLKGRGELESAVRSRPRRVGSQDSSESLDLPADLKQAYMDLAKAWWIVKEITPNHPELRRFGDASMQSIIPIIQKFGDQTLAQLLETHVNLVANMRALAMSMKRNGRLPPSTIEIQRLDARVLLESPDLPSTVADTLLPLDNKSKHNSATASMPLGDTDYYFTFSRTFGAGSLTSRNHSFKAIHIPCIMSVLRAKDSLHLSALISSQDGRVEIAIKPERREGSGLTWRDVRWRTSALYIGISPEIELCIQMSEPDFKAVWNICDYTRKVQKDSHGREGEALVFECRLYDFQCLQSTRHPSSFPTNPVKGCRARLFGKTQTLSEDSGERRIHAGHRLMVMTTPQAKPLNSVSQVYGDGMPTIFGFGRRDGEPRLALRVPNLSQLLLRFENWEDLDLFYNVFTQRQISSDESRSGSLALQNFGIAPVSTEDQPASESAIRLPIHRWQQVKVISRGTANHDQSAALEERSRSLRIIAQCDQGILTDRLNLAPGELQISLSVHDCNEIKLLRPPQRDIFLVLTDHELADQTLETWRCMLWAVGRSSNVKSYHFRFLPDLHSFQALVTGFEVAFEGVATLFAISRRRKGVPIYKQWEADFARLQIVRRDRSTQLIAFFKDFSHGACMNFVLKVTDVFETTSKSGEHVLRIVDAKFTLPKRNEDPTREFVCLDMPEYPSEHDDITIGFADEHERDRFVSQLPAEASKASRMGTLRR